jgi:hypothetical protein
LRTNHEHENSPRGMTSGAIVVEETGQSRLSADGLR